MKCHRSIGLSFASIRSFQSQGMRSRRCFSALQIKLSTVVKDEFYMAQRKMVEDTLTFVGFEEKQALDKENKMKFVYKDLLALEVNFIPISSSFMNIFSPKDKKTPLKCGGVMIHDDCNVFEHSFGQFKSHIIGQNQVELRLPAQSSFESKEEEYLREVIVPCMISPDMPDIFSEKYSAMSSGYLNVYEGILGATKLRLTPCSLVSLVIYSDQFDGMRSRLENQDQGKDRYISHEILVGGTYFRPKDQLVDKQEQQVQLTALRQIGLDIRFTNCSIVPKFFLEGPEAILEGTLSEIQSSRVMGGPQDLVEKKFGTAGDCWTETRALCKDMIVNTSWSSVISSKVKEMFGDSVIKVKGDSNKRVNSPKISKEPSIIE